MADESDRVSFGAAVRGITADLAREHGLPAAFGVEVGRVTPGSAADAAGIVPGDVIAEVGGYTLHGGSEQFRAAVAARRPGDLMILTVWRSGDRRTVEVRFPAPAPPADPTQAPPASG